jgi:hypothetical protein
VVKYLLKIDRRCFDGQLLLYEGKMNWRLCAECVRLPEPPRVKRAFSEAPQPPRSRGQDAGTVCRRLRAGGRRSYGASLGCGRQ